MADFEADEAFAGAAVKLKEHYGIEVDETAAWLDARGEKEKKDWLKDNRWKDVLEALRPYVEQGHIPESEAPVVGSKYSSDRIVTVLEIAS